MASVTLEVGLFYRAGLFGDNGSSDVTADSAPWKDSAEAAVEDAPALLVAYGLNTRLQITQRVMTAEQAAADNELIEKKKEKRAKDAV